MILALDKFIAFSAVPVSQLACNGIILFLLEKQQLIGLGITYIKPVLGIGHYLLIAEIISVIFSKTRKIQAVTAA